MKGKHQVFILPFLCRLYHQLTKQQMRSFSFKEAVQLINKKRNNRASSFCKPNESMTQTMITQHCYHHKRKAETSCASRRKNVTPLKVLQATGPFTAKTKNTTFFSLERNQQSLDYGKIRGTNILVCSSNKLQDKRREMRLLWWHSG